MSATDASGHVARTTYEITVDSGKTQFPRENLPAPTPIITEPIFTSYNLQIKLYSYLCSIKRKRFSESAIRMHTLRLRSIKMYSDFILPWETHIQSFLRSITYNIIILIKSPVHYRNAPIVIPLLIRLLSTLYIACSTGKI